MEGTAFVGPFHVTARLSRTGDAIPAKGDLEGTVQRRGRGRLGGELSRSRACVGVALEARSRPSLGEDRLHSQVKHAARPRRAWSRPKARARARDETDPSTEAAPFTPQAQRHDVGGRAGEAADGEGRGAPQDEPEGGEHSQGRGHAPRPTQVDERPEDRRRREHREPGGQRGQEERAPQRRSQLLLRKRERSSGRPRHPGRAGRTGPRSAHRRASRGTGCTSAPGPPRRGCNRPPGRRRPGGRGRRRALSRQRSPGQSRGSRMKTVTSGR